MFYFFPSFGSPGPLVSAFPINPQMFVAWVNRSGCANNDKKQKHQNNDCAKCLSYRTYQQTMIYVDHDWGDHICILHDTVYNLTILNL
jgi:hypothetical protein